HTNRAYDLNGHRAAFFLGPASRTSGRYLPLIPRIPIPNGIWVHLAASYSANTGVGKYYLNGALVARRVEPLRLNIRPSTEPLVIGANPRHSVTFFNGRIGMVRIWNQAHPASFLRAFSRIEAKNLPGLAAAYYLDGHYFDSLDRHHGRPVGAPRFVAGCATAMSYGQGTAGPFGVPNLGISGPPVLGTTPRLVASNPGGRAAIGAFLLGAQPASRRLLGGTLLVDYAWVGLLPVPSQGAAWPLAIPKDPILEGLPLF
ncbi:MAG: LamG-like jellyroll fold domain-containing protein, partial [Planctomycetota bacterium]